MWRGLFLLAGLSACSSTLPSLDEPFEPIAMNESPRPQPDVQTQRTCATRATVLQRTDVERFVAQGIGAALRYADIEPFRVQGRFVGFQIVRAHEIDVWPCAGLTLKEGDVIVSLNGMSITRPEQAQWAFETTRVAAALTVQFLRDGVTQVLTVPIEGPRTTASR